MPLTLRSPAFQDHGDIPTVPTCEGADTAPPLDRGTPTADTLEKVMRARVIERAELVGTYQCEAGRTR